MDSIERKKTKPYNINEKEILDIVAAKGSYLSSISENLEEVPPHKESSSRAESKKTITDEDSYGMTDTMGRMHSDAQFAGSSSVPAHVEMMGFLGMGNNPMVGATVAVAVAVEEAMKK